jgi:hypothetical protein
MARRSRSAATDPLADLARKLEILEREMALQREAMERLKAMRRPSRVEPEEIPVLPVRRTA